MCSITPEERGKGRLSFNSKKHITFLLTRFIISCSYRILAYHHIFLWRWRWTHMVIFQLEIARINKKTLTRNAVYNNTYIYYILLWNDCNTVYRWAKVEMKRKEKTLWMNSSTNNHFSHLINHLQMYYFQVNIF